MRPGGRGALAWNARIPVGMDIKSAANQVNQGSATSFSFASWRSLQLRSSILVVALVLSVTGSVAAYLLAASVKLAREFHDQQVVRLAAMAANATRDELGARDIFALKQFADNVTRGDPVVYLAFLDADGQVLAAATHNDPNLLAWVWSREEGRPERSGVSVHIAGPSDPMTFIESTYPIRGARAGGPLSARQSLDFLGEDTQAASLDAPPQMAPTIVRLRHQQGQVIGYVRVGLDGKRWVEAMAGKVDMLIGLAIIAAVVAIPLGFMLVRRIFAPLEEVCQAMSQFSEGKWHIRSQVTSQNEIGKLAWVFNQMADAHEQTHQRIVSLNATLEQRVRHRTAQLEELASRDPLTGLYNRRHFSEVLLQNFSVAVRYHAPLSCVMIDLDKFKQVNDTRGHVTGDRVLMLLAKTIEGQLRTADVAARFGGDEFVLLLPQTDLDSARTMSERVLAEFADSLRREWPDLTTGASAGLASLADPQVKSAEDLIRVADRALYRAKEAGQNSICAGGGDPQPIHIL